MLFLISIACTIGEPGPATEGSVSAQAAQTIAEIAHDAGAIANAARELEEMSDPARARVATGGDPTAEITRMRDTMAKVEALHDQVQAKLADLEGQLTPSAEAGAHSEAASAK